MSESGDQAGAARREASDPRSLADIVGEAVELPPAERGAFLAGACGGDAALLERARALIASHDRAAQAGFFAQPTGITSNLGENAPSAAELAREGTRIGLYTLGRCVGAGGFGVVFEAMQEEPIKRRVAIKLLRAGLATPQVVARFESERRALAMMEHPGIAKVLDAGATVDGTPYFVMEFVEGEPLVAFCDRNRLALRDRIELIVQVCRALQHAHAKGVIHRDIKPANILATMQDGRPLARIIDFGIAKAIEHVAVARAVFTRARQMIGTPEYMSPEQAGASPDIDTRSDIYSLGVVLYEVLAGVGPFDAEKLRSAAFAELERVLREDDPPRPSTRLSALASSGAGSSTATATKLTDIAATRRIEPRTLVRELQGELDWIVLRCLEKDRARRYDTAAALGDDLERYLRDEPVNAKPRSRMYLAHKFARRHRVGLAAAGVAVLSLVGGLGASLVGLAEARKAQRIAEVAREDERAQRERAEREAKKARAAADFLEKILSSADPEVGGRTMTVAAALTEAVALLNGGELREDPEVEASARRAIGLSFLALGDVREGEEQMQRAVDLSLTPGFDPVERARTLGMLSIPRWREERYEAAEAMLREALGLLEGKPERRAAIERAACLRDLSAVLFFQNKREESLKVLEEAKQQYVELFGKDSVEYADLMTSQGASLHANPRDTQPLRDAIAAHKRRYGNDHPVVARMLEVLGSTCRFTGDLDGMSAAFEESMVIISRAYGPRSRAVAGSMYNYAAGLANFNAIEECKRLLTTALEIAEETRPGEGDALVMRIEWLAGDIAMHEKRMEDAERHHRHAMIEGRAVRDSGLEYLRFGGSASLAEDLFAMGRTDEAQQLAGELLNDRQLMDSGVWPGVSARSTMGALLLQRKRYEEAETELLAAREKMSTLLYFRGSKLRLLNMERLVSLYEAWDAAEPGKGIGGRAGPIRDQMSAFIAKRDQRLAQLRDQVAVWRAGRARSESK
jgi:eukaryotic-like serine/threonine-protein kinase